MPLEACMIVIDNSEYMRNGDYAPNRFQAQHDAVSMVFNSKTGSNPENTCGVMSMAGQSPQVLATLTQDLGKVLSALQKNHIGGNVDLPTALNVAQLALKHRENKNQRQRIVVFLGSPLVDPYSASSSSSAAKASSEEALVKLGKKLKKNNVAVDIVLFGDEGMSNEGVLSKFVDATQNSENCNLVTIPPGPHLLSDLLATSPILAGEGGMGAGGAAGMDQDGDFGAGGGGGGGDFGLDPNMDPELAMAIRMSLQEEEDRQRREAGASGSVTTETVNPGAAAAATTATDPKSAPEPITPGTTEQTQPPPHPDSGMPSDTSGPISVPGVVDEGDVNMDASVEGEDEDEDEEQAMLRAIAMSMEDQGGQTKPEEEKKN